MKVWLGATMVVALLVSAWLAWTLLIPRRTSVAQGPSAVQIEAARAPGAEPTQQAPAVAEAPVAAAVQQKVKPRLVTDEKVPAVSVQTGSLAAQVPPLSTMRKEVAANPHVTPTSVIEFSLELNARMETGLQSEAQALALLSELKQCVGSQPDIATSIQSLCLLNARRLAERYSGLRAQYTQLEASAEPQVVDLAGRIP